MSIQHRLKTQKKGTTIMMKRRLIALFLAAALTLGLAACGKPSEPGSTAPAPSGSSQTPAPGGDAPKETITLKMWGGVQGEYGYDALVENFNKEFADKGICSATRFLRNADRINEKNEAGKITPQPRSFWPQSRRGPAANRTILRPTQIRYTRRKWPASAGSCHNGITGPYRS